MNLFFLNLGLTAGWQGLTGDFSLFGFFTGYVIGFAALYVLKPMYGETRYFSSSRRILGLVGFFVYDLVVSSVWVVWDIVTPPIYARPGIVAVPLTAETDAEILLTTNLISLTPGTLSLDVTEDRKILWVHAMFAEDPDKIRRELKQGIEARVLEALR